MTAGADQLMQLNVAAWGCMPCNHIQAGAVSNSPPARGQVWSKQLQPGRRPHANCTVCHSRHAACCAAFTVARQGSQPGCTACEARVASLPKHRHKDPQCWQHITAARRGTSDLPSHLHGRRPCTTSTIYQGKHLTSPQRIASGMCSASMAADLYSL